MKNIALAALPFELRELEEYTGHSFYTILSH